MKFPFTLLLLSLLALSPFNASERPKVLLNSAELSKAVDTDESGSVIETREGEISGDPNGCRRTTLESKRL